jgi:hypothetical protein
MPTHVTPPADNRPIMQELLIGRSTRSLDIHLTKPLTGTGLVLNHAGNRF